MDRFGPSTNTGSQLEKKSSLETLLPALWHRLLSADVCSETNVRRILPVPIVQALVGGDTP